MTAQKTPGLIYRVTKKDRSLRGKICLSGSKSISNRTLIIEALSGSQFEKKNIADANDTVLLHQLLSSKQKIFDAQDAGTAFRFLTAYLAFKEGEWLLTGSERMKQRPVGELVTALRHLGSEIYFLEEENFPPLKIIGGKLRGNSVNVNGNISSQFISALMMIAPCMKNGLTIQLAGEIVSEPYIEMTLAIMKYFGVNHSRKVYSIHIPAQQYQPKEIFIESDWSAASYYYEMAAFADEVDLEINGLIKNSFQGDAVIAEFMKSFGIETEFAPDGSGGKIYIRKKSSQSYEYSNFLFPLKEFPDLAPALFATAGGLSQKISFTGLEHLAYKESNREEALRTELAKCNIRVSNMDGKISVEGKFTAAHPRFSTYKDHRLAMALAPLAMRCDDVLIEEPMVVNKSYPKFWDDLKSLGFEVEDYSG